MAHYGYVIDSDLIPAKRKVYNLIVSYFGNPTLTKIKDENNCSIYASKVNLLLKETRYLLVSAIKDHHRIGVQFKLSDIKWGMLQTRTTSEEMNCTNFTYMPSGKAPFDTRLFLDERRENLTTYKSKDYPISLCLLHTSDSKYEYPDLGTLASALETYQTILKIET